MRRGSGVGLRNQYRALRLYGKSLPLFQETLRAPWRALVAPLSGATRFTTQEDGSIELPPGLWSMLPSACRLVAMGAQVRWEGADQCVRFGDLELHAPALDKTVAVTLREVFVDNVYRIDDADLTGQVVLDVGAYIGDTAIAFARRGATVHAFEPIPDTYRYLERNIALNRLDSRIVPHAVGLAAKNDALTVEFAATGAAGASARSDAPRKSGRDDMRSAEIQLVRTPEYLRAHGVTRADIIKLDCEGCEYDVLGQTELIDWLKPRALFIEYHRGGAPIAELLARFGYRIEWDGGTTAVGYLRALRA